MGAERKEYRWVGKRPIRPDGVDKVTGRAQFGADFALPNMLMASVLRSPHAHAHIRGIDTSAAAALPGVKAVITGADLPDLPSVWKGDTRLESNMHNMSLNTMAKDKVLYEGHAVAAVAATSASIAETALGLIVVDYEVLPHVIDPVEAMKPDAPLLHEGMITRNVTPPPDKPSNIAKEMEFVLGDLDKGFSEAEVIVERTYTTKAVHQGYIETHATVVNCTEDGQTTVWSSSQGQFVVRAFIATVLKMDLASIRVIPAEIGGGFGGKITPYLEPLCVLLSRKAQRPVKSVMSREDVFRATGPTSGGAMTIKIGAKKDGRITAAEGTFIYQAGAFPGSPVMNGCMCAFAPYDIANVRTKGYDVVVNRPKAAAYRAPGSPISAFGVESAIDELAGELGIAPLELRLQNAAREGTKAAYGPTFGTIGYEETVQAAMDHPQMKVPLGPNQGRGIASGFWFNGGGESSASISANQDGTVTVTEGSPDIGGSRASMAIMAAEVLGIDYDKVKPSVVDTNSIGYTHVTGGSRVTFATGMAVVEATQGMVREMCGRAAKIWDISPDAVEWADGEARPAGPNAGDFEPLSLAQLAAMAGQTGGPITGHSALNAQAPGPGFGTHVCDVEVDPETGLVTILRYTAVQDVGRAIHPSYVEGQMQGGVAQGVGWALNEEYIYDKDGRLENPGFLDYRVPVCSDLPMIDTVLVEVPHPRHPFGVKGVGEVPIVPPMAAVANAIADATGVRLVDLPMSPPKVLAAIDNGG